MCPQQVTTLPTGRASAVSGAARRRRPPARLVLDTSVVRFIATDRQPLAGLKRFRAEGGAVHLADGAVLELSAALIRGQLPWTDWALGRNVLGRLLDPSEPTLIGGRELLASQGVTRVEGEPCPPPTLLREMTQSAWRCMCAAPNLDAFRSMRTAKGLRWDFAKAPALQKLEQQGWVSAFEGVLRSLAAGRERGESDESRPFEAVVAELGAGLDAAVLPAEPRASVRLGAMIRVYLHWSESSMRRKQPYNPAKHTNDALDLELLRYFAFPAGVCARDRRLQNVLSAANAWQQVWVVTPKELEQGERRQQLLELSWCGTRGPS